MEKEFAIMNVGGNDYEIIREVKDQFNSNIPLLDIKMMSDEKWEHLAVVYNTKSFKREFNREPVNYQEVIDWVKMSTADYTHVEVVI